MIHLLKGHSFRERERERERERKREKKREKERERDIYIIMRSFEFKMGLYIFCFSKHLYKSA